MTIQDIRRKRLAKLIADRYNESQAEFVLATGENQGEVSGLLKTKSFGEKKARKLEVKCGLPVGWLDGVEDAEAAGTGEDSTVAGVGRLVEVESPKWMAPEAYELLTLYYSADDDGRAEIMSTARDFARVSSKNVIHNKA